MRLRQDRARPIVDDLESWLQAQLPRTSGKSELAKAIRYALARMRKLRPYRGHGCPEADNNGAGRALKPVALGRRNLLFVGSEGGGRSAAIAYTLIETAKLNGINPQAWLTDILGCIADHTITRINELLPWRYAAAAAQPRPPELRQTWPSGRSPPGRRRRSSRPRENRCPGR